MSDWRMVREDSLKGLHTSEPFQTEDQAKAEEHFKPFMDYWKAHGEKVWLTKDGGPVYQVEKKGLKGHWFDFLMLGGFLALGYMVVTNPDLQATQPVQPPWWIWLIIPAVFAVPLGAVMVLLAIPTEECEVCHKRIWRHKVSITDKEAKLYGGRHWLYPVHDFHRKCYAYRTAKEITA
jgi:hypothetical protein